MFDNATTSVCLGPSSGLDEGKAGLLPQWGGAEPPGHG